MKSPITLLSSLLNDFKRLLQCEKGLDRDILTIKNRIEHEGISFLTVTLSSYSDALERGLAQGCFTCPSAFSKVRRGVLPKLFSGLLSEVFDLHTGLILDNPSVECIRCIREVCRLYKKLRLESSRKDFLHDKAIRSFEQDDRSLATVKFDGGRVRRLRRTTLHILRDLDKSLWNDVVPNRHGPGAVREGCRGNQKWQFLHTVSSDPASTTWGLEPIRESSQLSAGSFSFVETPLCTSFGGESRYITVPKSATAVRGITIEPVVNQFIQQGLNTILRDSITRCRILSNCLDLSDQRKNQLLALEGSHNGKWATVDLSSASDLLSLDLVKEIFRNSPSFLEGAVSCRSNLVDVDSKTLAIRKFAGMGNALTFPIQSVVFACLCISAILEQDGIIPSYKEVLRASKSVRVFGDDIIIRNEYYHTVESWIEAFGLRVNTSKSFHSGSFRESCGTDAYNGVDVTPTYLRVDPCSKQLTSSDISSLVSTSDQLWLKGLYAASNVIRHDVESRIGRLPLVSPDSGLLGWSDRYLSTEAHYWDPVLQRLMVKGKAVRSVKRSDKLDGHAALLKFYHTSLIERPDGHLSRTAMRYKTRIVAARAPAYAGFKVAS